jgi:hypothetical protein
MANVSWNVENTVTGELILDGEGIAIEYNTSNEAMTAAIYYTGVTGQQHVIAGPHPRPHA